MQQSLPSLVWCTVHALHATQTACPVLLQVVTYTSDVRGAGSDATVYAQPSFVHWHSLHATQTACHVFLQVVTYTSNVRETVVMCFCKY